GKREWIDGGMAAGANRIAAVQFHPLANRLRLNLVVRRQVGHIRRRWRRRGSQQIFENPLSTLDGRRAIWLGGHSEDARLTQQPSSLRIGQCQAPEPGAVNPWDPVVLRQTVVEERVIRGEQIENAVILAKLAREK